MFYLLHVLYHRDVVCTQTLHILYVLLHRKPSWIKTDFEEEERRAPWLWQEGGLLQPGWCLGRRRSDRPQTRCSLVPPLLQSYNTILSGGDISLSHIIPRGKIPTCKRYKRRRRPSSWLELLEEFCWRGTSIESLESTFQIVRQQNMDEKCYRLVRNNSILETSLRLVVIWVIWEDTGPGLWHPDSTEQACNQTRGELIHR